jgi:hypothetical protein
MSAWAFDEEHSMKRSIALIAALLSVLSLSACDRESKTVVATPPPMAPAAVPVPVPGPPGPQGEPGKDGAPGATGVVVVPPAASEPK